MILSYTPLVFVPSYLTVSCNNIANRCRFIATHHGHVAWSYFAVTTLLDVTDDEDCVQADEATKDTMAFIRKAVVHNVQLLDSAFR